MPHRAIHLVSSAAALPNVPSASAIDSTSSSHEIRLPYVYATSSSPRSSSSFHIGAYPARSAPSRCEKRDVTLDKSMPAICEADTSQHLGSASITALALTSGKKTYVKTHEPAAMTE